MIAMYPPQPTLPAPPTKSISATSQASATPEEDETEIEQRKKREGWTIAELDPLLNARRETAEWARGKIGGGGGGSG